MRYLVCDDDWRMDDALWTRVKSFLPASQSTRTSAARHRPRIDDRIIMDAILLVLRSRSHWKALDHYGRPGSGSTVHRRFREWACAGVFREMRRAGVLDLDPLRNLDWERIECRKGYRKLRESYPEPLTALIDSN
ncbi:transposase [Cupriavidus agavae]|uniref:Putative transposase of IS4/5 family DUF4096 n=1 Tax=Cupriavidus agavae TaxID=1001822 RepID=A0A4Q7RXF3_9BURK|nr:transposase [Cupriavidus agavae]RZT38611.1 putative transposase of IS4/5 family DUF4096 [Cupriavidus agavae]